MRWKLKGLLCCWVASGLLILTLFSDISACTCADPSACQAFGRADKVFVGKLLKLTTNRVANLDFLRAEFDVEETYKGKTSRIENVEFLSGGCEPTLMLDEKYFVYKEQPSRISIICNRTRNLKVAKDDLAYAQRVSTIRPIFTLGGWIQGLSKAELAKTKIYVAAAGRKRFLKLSESGRYEMIFSQDANYIVTIALPLSVNGWLDELGSQSEVHGTEVRYSTKFRPNMCDFRVIQITPASRNGERRLGATYE